MTPPLLPLPPQPGQRLLDGEGRLPAPLLGFVPGDVALEGVGVVGLDLHPSSSPASAWPAGTNIPIEPTHQKDRQMATFDSGIDPCAPLFNEDGSPTGYVRELVEHCARIARADPAVVAAALAGDTETVNAAIAGEIEAELGRRLHITRIVSTNAEAREIMVEVGWPMLSKEIEVGSGLVGFATGGIVSEPDRLPLVGEAVNGDFGWWR